MRRKNFLVLSIRKNILPAIFCIFTICLVLFSRENMEAAKNGLALWANSVVPSLLPFFIATELLSHTNIIPTLGKIFGSIMKPLFRVPGEGSFAFMMGIISGYPVGAKIVTDFRSRGICTKAEAERMLAFTNNSGPLFIIATVGVSLFGDTRTGFLLFFTHLLACITVAFCFRFWKRNDTEKPSATFASKDSQETVCFSNLGEILAKSIINSVYTIVMIGGFVVLFSVVICILKQTHLFSLVGNLLKPFFSLFGIPASFATPMLTGIIELTNGISQVANISQKAISTNMILSAFLLGFGGISILLQVFSIITKSDLSIKPYFIGKLLQGIFAAFYTYLLITKCSFFNLDLEAVSNNLTPALSTSTSPFSSAITFAIFLLFFLLFLLSIYVTKKREKADIS